MADKQQTPEERPYYDPLTAEGGPKGKKGGVFMIATIVAFVLHAGLIFYLWKVKFEPKYKQYVDDATQVEIVKPPPPPPPPPPQQPTNAPPPPATVPPRPPIAAPPDVVPPPPLPIPPVEKRVEQPAPPVITQAPPAPTPPRPSVITRPDWLRRPGAEDYSRYYPDRAQRTETNGSATLRCIVTATGTLQNCEVVSETPADYGFGDAALRLSRLFKMRPQTSDGNPVEGGQVTIPLTFRMSS
ncbi:MAG: energy transducer TonB [Caulobacterales bacterium]|nr:energy transducer TonB [Caulobacterales bacterium]